MRLQVRILSISGLALSSFSCTLPTIEPLSYSRAFLIGVVLWFLASSAPPIPRSFWEYLRADHDNPDFQLSNSELCLVLKTLGGSPQVLGHAMHLCEGWVFQGGKLDSDIGQIVLRICSRSTSWDAKPNSRAPVFSVLLLFVGSCSLRLGD